MQPPSPPQDPPPISIDDVGDIVHARWRHLNGRQRLVAIIGAAFVLTGAGLAFADIVTAGILVSLFIDFCLIGIGLGAFVWIAFQLKILTKGHVEQTRQSATRAAMAAVQAIAPPPPPAPASSAPVNPSKSNK